MMESHLLDYETKRTLSKLRGPVYQMRKSLTFNENKALGEWVCDFDKERNGNNEDQG